MGCQTIDDYSIIAAELVGRLYPIERRDVGNSWLSIEAFACHGSISGRDRGSNLSDRVNLLESTDTEYCSSLLPEP